MSCKWLAERILTIINCNLAVLPELNLKMKDISVSRPQLREKNPCEVSVCHMFWTSVGRVTLMKQNGNDELIMQI